MVMYSKLQEQAKDLPELLLRRLSRSQFGCLFSVPSTWYGSSLNDAQLISRFATELENYPEPDGIKCKVLTGIYLMVWSYHNQQLNQWLESDLIFLLQTHLEVDSPLQMERGLICESLDKLSDFCSWLYENRENKNSLMTLYNGLPETIQVDIYHLKTAPWPSSVLKMEYVETVKTYLGL
jgi:hypothetical protein